MLAMLDTSKSWGPDDISSMMLKSTAYSIAPSLAKLFNTSLAEGTLPTERKLARVVPIPKFDAEKNSVTGYRPISILPNVSKILEHHVSDIILGHICEATLSPTVSGDSCTTAPPHPLLSLSFMTGLLFSITDKRYVWYSLMYTKLSTLYHIYLYCKSWNKSALIHTS